MKMKTIINLIAITPIIISFLNAEITVIDAAKIWIRQYDNTEDINQINVVHPSKLLDIISRYGHSLPDNIKNDLAERGFNFSREIVTTQRPQNLDSYIDQGLFRFHYTTTGDDAVNYVDGSANGIPDYIDSVLAIFFEISVLDFDLLDYTKPPSDGWYTAQDNGGSEHYDVYLFNLPTGYYGYVMGENYAQADDIIYRGDNENSLSLVETNAMTSFMALRNNYDDFPGNTFDVIEVTSAHEFFHAVQYGYDGWEFGWVKEATAVWMEELHYDEINDCYQFLNTFLDNPGQSFNHDTNQGYGSYIFFSYLTEHYVPNQFIKDYWSNAAGYDSWQQDYSIQTLAQTLDQYDLDLETVTKNFHVANGILSDDQDLGLYHYEEAGNFPTSIPQLQNEFELYESNEEIIIQGSLNSFAADYYLIEVLDSSLVDIGLGESSFYIDLETNYGIDTNVTAYLTTINRSENMNISSIYTQNSQQIERQDIDSLILVISGFNFNFNVVTAYGSVEYDDVQYTWTIKVPDLVLSLRDLGVVNDFSLKQNYPNPFNGITNIEFKIPQQTNTSLVIFDLKGNEVINLFDQEVKSGRYNVPWNGLNSVGELVSSGTYFYQLKTDNYQKIRKLLYVK